jgi:hypothetical protein
VQPLARDGLTTEQVTALLLSDNLSVTAGCELLTPTLTVREDISADLEGGRIERAVFATIHGTCTLNLARALSWGIDHVRPYMTLSDGSVTARFNCGVYVLTTPERVVGSSPETYSVQGYDRVMLLQRQVGAAYTVTAGTTYRTAILNTFTAAGLTGVLIEGSAADSTLPTARTWPLVANNEADPDQTTTPATWLRVINDLLRAINFRGVWADENGLFRCEPYRDPDSRPVEFTFDADSVKTIVGEQRTLIEDMWATPNRWVFRQTNRAVGAPVATEGDGIYTVVNQTDGPTSINARGLTWTSVVDYEAASQAALVGLGNRRVKADRRLTSQLKVTVGPFPCAGHADVYAYRDSAVGNRTVQAVRWSYDLSGSDVQMEWEAVS